MGTTGNPFEKKNWAYQMPFGTLDKKGEKVSLQVSEVEVIRSLGGRMNAHAKK